MTVATEYYQHVFYHLTKTKHVELTSVLVEEPKLRSRLFWGSWAGQRLTGEPAWSRLREYLGVIEERMRLILARHSVFCWMHAYRRIGVSLADVMPDKIDSTTTALVRDALETAITKWGALSRDPMDVRLASQVEPMDVLSGLALSLLPHEQREGFSASLRSSRQYVLCDFTPDDFVDLYRLEGLAYEHWQTTARMRSIGKGSGASLVIDDNADIGTDRTDDLEELVVSYDQRIESPSLGTSHIGTGMFASQPDRELRTIVPQYNLEQEDFTKVCPWWTAGETPGFVSNFYYGVLDLDAYYRSHCFLAEQYRTERGFALDSFCGFLAALNWFEIRRIILDPESKSQLLLRLYQRAYRTIGNEPAYWAEIRQVAVGLMDVWRGEGRHSMDRDFEAIVAFLFSPSQANTSS